MLPQDTRDRRKSLADELLHQTSVDDHFKPTTAEEKPTAYSDEIFKNAAIEWLIETNQVRNNPQMSNYD
jgi:hypothetical protein